MTTRNLWTTTTITFILSTAGMSFWLYEILEIKGWYSLNWLSGQLYSPYIATLFSVFAFMTPFFINRQLTAKKTIICIIIFYMTNIICFQIGKQLCYTIYSKFWLLSSVTTDLILILLIALVLFIFIGLSYRLTTHRLIRKNKKINMLFITLLLLLSIPLSLLTIQINRGFGSGTDWVDAVKMGYPIFWTTMLLGLIGIIIARQPDLVTTDKTK
jgi:hypothetical protein